MCRIQSIRMSLQECHLPASTPRRHMLILSFWKQIRKAKGKVKAMEYGSSWTQSLQTSLRLVLRSTHLESKVLWHLMQRTDSLEKTLLLGKIEGRRRRG